MNIYDFDGTIFKGDSTRAFWAYCLKRNPLLVRYLPRQCFAALCYLLGRTDKEAFKQAFFSYLQGVPAVEEWVEGFWYTHMGRFQPWYLSQKQPGDLIISASPEFLLAPACRRLGVRPPVASQVEAQTGRTLGSNCKGIEKVNRLRQEYPDAVIENFYSDSNSDAPLARLAQKAYFVKGSDRIPWQL